MLKFTRLPEAFQMLRTGGGYRHEIKYEINRIQLETLKSRLPVIMKSDPHSGESGRYTVRSVYFDDFENRCFYENEDGTDPRQKYRLRIYNGSSDRISLELKRKESGMTCKRACRISREQAERLLDGRTLLWDEAMDDLLKDFYVLQQTRCLTPKMIVEYDRVPFVYSDGNVRITLDLNIRASAKTGDFLECRTNCRPIMPAGMNLLEVKYDQLLPDHIYRSIQMRGLQQTTFSKYYLCRKFGGIS